jgi:ABC-2 type transport system permease protein
LSFSASLRRALRAYPTLLQVGFAEAVAYRAETIVWMLTNTMPLVNLALWSAITRSGTVAGYGQKDLVAYFLGALVVRQLTSSWVLWEMSREIRSGMLSMRLLRPVHPLIAYSAENLSALPLRAFFAVPLAGIVLAIIGTDRLAHDPVAWAMVPAAMLGAWMMMFLVNALLGTLNFYLEQAMSLFDVWLAAYFTLSGYLFPLDFFNVRAPWVAKAARLLPFYAMNGFPLELLLGLRTRAEALQALAIQWSWVTVMFVSTLLLWRAGLRRYNAYGA